MVEINNTFLLSGLVIVAVTCIYLLYVSFNGPDLTSFKNTINNMVQQNKKRDEIVNFLLDKVQNLNTLVSSLQQSKHNVQMVSNDNLVDHTSIVNEEKQLPNESHVEHDNVNNLMEHIDEVLPPSTIHQEELTSDDLQKMEEISKDNNVVPTREVLQQSEFMVDGESEFESVMNIIQNNNISSAEEVVDGLGEEEVVDGLVEEEVGDGTAEEVVDGLGEEEVVDGLVEEEVGDGTAEEVVDDSTNNVVIEDLNLERLHTMFKETGDLVVNNVLEELEEFTLSEEDLTYLKNLPQDKNVLANKYSGNDLKEICKRFNLVAYGKKVEMAERILNLLN